MVAIQKSLEASIYGDLSVSAKTLQVISPSQLTHTPTLRLILLLAREVPGQDVCVDRLGQHGTKPKNMVFLDLYVPDGRNSRPSHLNPRSPGMLHQQIIPYLSLK